MAVQVAKSACTAMCFTSNSISLFPNAGTIALNLAPILNLFILSSRILNITHSSSVSISVITGYPALTISPSLGIIVCISAVLGAKTFAPSL